ncbi:hypothetical protein DXG03_002125 [Asterophora parasitica]|uniref:Nephrocystin 3-like N-terminal domain-containing protein n=1 Tax=Asterophora parasitica TaxID=117018 RepID=A0A9P7KBC7_9AGAR|nr:hypothetical protein DXG03_002125 [Asterophora parasitica]
MHSLFPTLAFQLATHIPGMRDKIAKAINEDASIVESSTRTQVEHLLAQPLSEVDIDLSNPVPFLIVIDGLDECGDNDEQTVVLSHIGSILNSLHLPLSFIIVSRPEPHIKHAFDSDEFRLRALTENMSLYGDLQALDDVRIFLRQEFERIQDSERHSAIKSHVPKPWPADTVHERLDNKSVLDCLSHKSGGYFIYVSVILKFVDEEYHSPLDRLAEVLTVVAPSSTVFAELDRLYSHRMLRLPCFRNRA